MKKIFLFLASMTILVHTGLAQYADYMYFTDRDQMTTRYFKVSEPGNIMDFSFGELDKPYGIVVDSTNNYVFVSDATTGKIHRYNMDGTSMDVILDIETDTIVGYPFGLAMYNNQLYWGREGGIGRCDIDGSNAELILQMSLSTAPEMAIGLAFNPDDNMLYFTNDKYDYSGGVYRLNPDGTGLEMIVSGTDGVAIAVDWEHDKLYYCDYLKGVCMNEYDGSSETVIDADYVDAVIWGLVVDMYGEKIYYTDKYDNKLLQANLDGSSRIDFITDINFYALAWVSQDVTGLIENSWQTFFKLYPNPAIETLCVEFRGQYEELNIRNNAGQLVLKQDVRSGLTNTVDIGGLNSGVYLITLRGNGNSVSQKLLIR